MIKKSFKKGLFATASVAALSMFAAGDAHAVALAATGNTANDDDLTLDATGGIVMGEALANTQADTTAIVILNSAGDFTSGAYTHARTNTTGAAGSVIVSSANSTSATDVNISAGGVLTHDDETAGAFAINIVGAHTVGTITNLGKITTSATNGDVINIANGATGNIVNGDDSATAASITATGTGEAITLAGSLVGSITNKAGALISGAASNAGLIDVDGVITGSITNAGSITVTGAGLALDVGNNISGGVTNSGSIGGASGAGLINVSGAATFNLTNTGSITASGAGTGIDVEAKITGAITNGADGTATSLISTVGGVGVDLGADVTGGVVNWGSITETTGKAIDVTAAVATGGIDNKAGAIIKATTGEAIDVGANLVGNITNAGTIQTTAGGGAIITTAASDVDITNTGTIQDTGDGIAISITGGTMTGTITNTGGLITSASTTNTNDTINIDQNVTGDLTNTGTISATTATSGSAISIATNMNVDITNTGGTITAAGAQEAIEIEGQTDGSITNTGTISGTGTGGAIAISDLQYAASNDGDINNTGGTITAGTAATVDTITIAVGIDGTLTNTGTISSTATGAISAISGIFAVDATGAASSVFLSNSGLITSAGTTDTIDVGNGAAGTITNTGTISNTGTGAVLELSGETSGDAITITNSGNITAAAATTAAIVGGAGTDTLNWNGGTITGTIDLGSEDADTINIGDSSSDSISTGGAITTGGLTVKQGTFNVGHAITLVDSTQADEDFSISNGATASITESITLNAGDVDVNGTLAIANTKTLTVTPGAAGTIDTANGSKLTFGISKNSDFAKLDADGVASVVNVVSGTTIHFDTSAGTEQITAGTLESVITSGGSATIDGSAYTDALLTAATTVTDDSYVLGFAISADSDANGIDIAITRDNAYNTSSTEANASAVGSALETIANTGDSNLDTINGTLDAMSTAAEIETALKTLTPDMSGAVNGAASAASSVALGVVGNRLDQIAGISGSTIATGGMSYNNGIWGEVFGAAADQNYRKQVRGYQADTGGIAFGADTKIDDVTTLGASFSYANTDADSANGNVEIDGYQLTVYGTRDYGKWYGDALVGFTHNSFDAKRNVVVGAISNQAKADFDGQQYTAKIGGGYKVDVEGGLNVTPVASLQYDYITTDKYTETGSTANLTVDTDDSHVFKSDLGVKLNYPIVDGSVTYIPEISASWTYDFVGDEQESVNNFTGATGTLFTTKGASVAQHAMNIGLGLDILAQDNVTVSFDYDWTNKEDFDSHAGSLKARFAF